MGEEKLKEIYTAAFQKKKFILAFGMILYNLKFIAKLFWLSFWCDEVYVTSWTFRSSSNAQYLTHVNTLNVSLSGTKDGQVSSIVNMSFLILELFIGNFNTRPASPGDLAYLRRTHKYSSDFKPSQGKREKGGKGC